MKKLFLLFCLSTVVLSCSKDNDKPDLRGNPEAGQIQLVFEALDDNSRITFPCASPGGIIDWGDGSPLDAVSSSTYDWASHTYSRSGVYTITIDAEQIEYLVLYEYEEYYSLTKSSFREFYIGSKVSIQTLKIASYGLEKWKAFDDARINHIYIHLADPHFDLTPAHIVSDNVAFALYSSADLMLDQFSMQRLSITPSSPYNKSVSISLSVNSCSNLNSVLIAGKSYDEEDCYPEITSLQANHVPNLEVLNCSYLKFVNCFEISQTEALKLWFAGCFFMFDKMSLGSGIVELKANNRYPNEEFQYELDLTGCSELEELYLSSEPVRKVDISNLKKLTHADVNSYDGLVEFNAFRCSGLESVGIRGSERLTHLDFANMPKCERIDVSYNSQLTSLNIHDIPALKYLEIFRCNLDESAVESVIKQLPDGSPNNRRITFKENPGETPKTLQMVANLKYWNYYTW